MTDWEGRYQTKDMPWEKGAPHPELITFLRREPVLGRVLVPGCGYGHDVRALAATADEVIGLDIAPSAIVGARQFGEIGGETYIAGDFFKMPARTRGTFDWLFEHTCFCAIPPALRDDYVRAAADALRPGGHLLAIFYMTPDMEPGEGGPPFGSTREELDALFSAGFRLAGEWVPSRTHPGREGRELCRVLERRADS